MDKLQEIKKYLNNMDPNDENVIAMKALLDSIISETKLYMLYYNGKPLHFTMTNNGDADFCNDMTVELTDDDYYPIWTTNDVRIAAYVKYVSTDWYNSSIETPVNRYVKEELEIRDSFGTIYNRKPLKFKTYAVIEAELFGDDDGLHRIKHWNNIDWDNQYLSIYQQTTYLDEVKDRLKRRAGKVPIKGMSLGSLYSYRKDLVTAKGELLKAGKPFDKIQKKLDSVNKKILKLGGR